MYTYKGTIKRIIDADTMDAEIDVGFNIKVNVRIRIKGYDAPESFRPSCDTEKEHAIKATEKAKELLIGELIFKTYKEGVYNRYIADIIINGDINYANQMQELGFSKLDKY